MTIQPGADFLGAVEILQRAAALKPMARQLAAYQCGSADTYGLLLDGHQVGLIGFWPNGEGVEECFFACLPLQPLAAPSQRCSGRVA